MNVTVADFTRAQRLRDRERAVLAAAERIAPLLDHLAKASLGEAGMARVADGQLTEGDRNLLEGCLGLRRAVLELQAARDA